MGRRRHYVRASFSGTVVESHLMTEVQALAFADDVDDSFTSCDTWVRVAASPRTTYYALHAIVAHAPDRIVDGEVRLDELAEEISDVLGAYDGKPRWERFDDEFVFAMHALELRAEDALRRWVARGDLQTESVGSQAQLHVLTWLEQREAPEVVDTYLYACGTTRQKLDDLVDDGVLYYPGHLYGEVKARVDVRFTRTPQRFLDVVMPHVGTLSPHQSGHDGIEAMLRDAVASKGRVSSDDDAFEPLALSDRGYYVLVAKHEDAFAVAVTAA